VNDEPTFGCALLLIGFVIAVVLIAATAMFDILKGA
jgi:hypothetical protein